MSSVIKWFYIIAITCFVVFPVNSVVMADDITDAINEALNLYSKGDFAGAAGSLDYAAQLVRQKTGGKMVDMLPKPLPGWSADEPVSNAAGGAMMGGGAMASRAYSKGDSSVDITITADAPMLQGMIMMLSNPMFATSSGGRLARIAGHKAVVRYSRQDREGEVQLVIANRFLVTVSGSAVSEDDLKAYAAKVDYDGLAKLE